MLWLKLCLLEYIDIISRLVLRKWHFFNILMSTQDFKIFSIFFPDFRICMLWRSSFIGKWAFPSLLIPNSPPLHIKCRHCFERKRFLWNVTNILRQHMEFQTVATISNMLWFDCSKNIALWIVIK